MDLSVIIVNYNVKYFLEQCLYSVRKSLDGIKGEIFVVDNNSVDASCQMVKEKFPEVKLIENKENLGFSKANNQAIQISKGKYILLLNPDTVVQENTLQKCIQFMNENPKAGALGVKMIDGKGNFLPESKRSLPTPAVAFYKIFGLSTFFPRSRIFGRYHLGYLDKEETHQVEVLAGAFMFIRKETLDKTGLLDENFFMYGEDIDLSYRIEKAGYKNFYFPGTTIIHYKGESTKKGSINYVLVFYKAMILFARKHFTTKNAKLYSFLIYLAIYFRASLSILRRIFLNSITPLLDFVSIYFGFIFFTPFWERYKFGHDHYYPSDYFMFIVPGYILIWMLFIYLSGGYNNKVRVFTLIRSTATGTAFILLIYALLPEDLRFSRALILFGSIWALISAFIVRMILSICSKTIISIEFRKSVKRILLVGDKNESERVSDILLKSEINPVFVGRVSTDKDENETGLLGSLTQINEVVKINKVDELVFCAKSLSSEQIMKAMLMVDISTVDFKIAPPESLSIIGSSSINTAGDLYVVHFDGLNKEVNKRAKRLFDIIMSMVMFSLFPILVFVVRKPFKYIINTIKVFLGLNTWVGYTGVSKNHTSLPKIPPGILTPLDGIKRKVDNEQLKEKIDLLYAKDYKIANDIRIIFEGYRNLGR